jgi:hypothetical protein
MSDVLLTYGWVRSSYSALRNLKKHDLEVVVSDSSSIGMSQFSRFSSGFKKYTSHYKDENKFILDILEICAYRRTLVAARSVSCAQGEGESRESHEVYEFVAPLWYSGRRLERKEGSDCQDGRHDSCEGDIEILAHRLLLLAQHPRHKPTFKIGHSRASRNPINNSNLVLQISGPS